TSFAVPLMRMPARSTYRANSSGCAIVCGQIQVEQRLAFCQFAGLRGTLLHVVDDLSEHGLVMTSCLGFGVDLANVGLDGSFFLAHAEDAIHESLDLVL